MHWTDLYQIFRTGRHMSVNSSIAVELSGADFKMYRNTISGTSGHRGSTSVEM